MEWLRRLYARRIVNVNVNIVLAGVLALGPTVAVVALSRLFVDDHHHFLIMAITFGADLISDVTIYFGLHWLANHSANRRFKAVEGAYAHMSFIRDASIVQIQRAVLSPVLYGVAFGLQYFLMKQGFPREAATALGLVSGILSTRVLHTFWMVKEERSMSRNQAKAGTDSGVAGEASSVPVDGVAATKADVLTESSAASAGSR